MKMKGVDGATGTHYISTVLHTHQINLCTYQIYDTVTCAHIHVYHLKYDCVLWANFSYYNYVSSPAREKTTLRLGHTHN